MHCYIGKATGARAPTLDTAVDIEHGRINDRGATTTTWGINKSADAHIPHRHRHQHKHSPALSSVGLDGASNLHGSRGEGGACGSRFCSSPSHRAPNSTGVGAAADGVGGCSFGQFSLLSEVKKTDKYHMPSRQRKKGVKSWGGGGGEV